MNALLKMSRYLTLLFILLFSAVSIFLSLEQREIDKEQKYPWLGFASFLEDRFYDIRMLQTLNPKQKSNDVVLAALDDQSFQKIGRWPWTRSVWVDVLKKLKTFGAKVVAFDVVFPEAENACNTTPPDELFRDAITDFQSDGTKKVLLSYSLADVGEPSFKEVPGEMYNYVVNTQQSSDAGLISQKISSQNFPIPKLLEADPGVSFIGANADVDGIFRHYPLLANVDTLYFPSLGLQAYQFFTGDNSLLELTLAGSVLKLKKGQLNLNYHGETKVRFIGDSSHFKTISMKNILEASDNDPLMLKNLKNKIVFIGSTAFGAHDLRHTPVDAQLPGVYFHMNLVHMLLEGYFFKDKVESLKISYAILLIGFLILFGILQLKNAIVDLLTLIILCGGSYILDTYYLLPQGYETRLFFCLFTFISCYSFETFINFYKTSQEKKQIKGTFARYVAPAIVNEMLSNPDKLKVGGEKKNITVMFSDVRDFTSISEKLSAQQLSTCLNKYMGKMTDILFETYGTLDKYIGDAIVGYWGAPVDVKDHAYHGVRGAVKMIETLPLINEEFKKEGFPQFKVGIGLNTGECSVGNMGSDKIFSYTALGDHMNLGSRIESLCKSYGAQILISEFTYEAIPENLRQEFHFRQVDLVRVKGKENAVKLYEVLHSTHPFRLDPKVLNLFNEAYQLYLQQKFSQAEKIFQEILIKIPDDKPSQRLMATTQHFLEAPPTPDWDGVTVHKEK